jgi:hypothetical protein
MHAVLIVAIFASCWLASAAAFSMHVPLVTMAIAALPTTKAVAFSSYVPLMTMAITALPTTKAFIATVPTGTVVVRTFMGQIQEHLHTTTFFYPWFVGDIWTIKHVEDTDVHPDLQCVSKEGVPLLAKGLWIKNEIDRSKILSTLKKYGQYYDQELAVKQVAPILLQICSQWTQEEITQSRFPELPEILRQRIQDYNDQRDTGVKINAVMITQFVIPAELAAAKLALAAEKQRQLLATEEKKRTQTEQERLTFIKTQEIERLHADADSKNQLSIKAMQTQYTENQISVKMIIETGEANAQATIAQSKALREYFSIPGYAELEQTKAFASNTKIWMGPGLPTNQVIVQSGSDAMPGIIPTPMMSEQASTVQGA